MSQAKIVEQSATDKQHEKGFYLPGVSSETLARIERLFKR